jgi:hypothetical protein
MSLRFFLLRLLAVALGTAAVFSLLFTLLEPVRVHTGFSIATLLLFMLVCIGLFFAGRASAQSSNKYAFNNLIIASVFGKMLLAVAFLFVYQESMRPLNQWFVGIFLWAYINFTIYEVWFMMRLAKLKKPD